MSSIIKYRGRWYKFYGSYNSKEVAHKKGYIYRKKHKFKKSCKYKVIPFGFDVWGLFVTLEK